MFIVPLGSSRRSFSRPCSLLLGSTTSVPRPALDCLFPATELELFFDAIHLEVSMHRGDGPFRLRPAARFPSQGLGREHAKMERVSEVLQFPVIIEWRRVLSIKPQPF